VPPPPIKLWRTPRERGVWLRDLRRALLTAAPGGVAYVAAALADRVSRVVRDWPLAMKVGGRGRVVGWGWGYLGRAPGAGAAGLRVVGLRSRSRLSP
jgi:hypothetical protein